MKKRTIEYDSRVDALVALAKRLAIYEHGYGLETEEFFDQYTKGNLDDSEKFVEWANDYQHYLAMREEIEERLQHAA
ncbi:MAG: hypothetical protein HY879_03425 [Deltaproteobacteria bacterium]|nr:hypothetical protein [Deltaproteobacteria bacterium]